MNDTAGGGWSSLPGGKRRGRGKRGCRGGTFGRVRSTGGVRRACRRAEEEAGTFSRVTAGAPAAGGWCRWCARWVVAGQETEGAVVGVSRVRSTGGVREKRGSRHGAGCERGFLVYPGVRRAGAQEEGGGRAAGSGGFSRVTGAPLLLMQAGGCARWVLSTRG